MKIKVSEAIGAQLDWMVAKCEGYTVRHDPMGFGGTANGGYWVWQDKDTGHADVAYWQIGKTYSPSTDWAQGGPIIDALIEDGWILSKADFDLGIKLFRIKDVLAQIHRGPTSLIAACRCFVTSKLGEEFEVPDEL